MIKKYKISEYARLNNVSIRTVWNWIKLNKIKTEKKITNRWLIIEEKPIKPIKVAIYARVSSSENKSNLDTQTDRIVSYANAKGYKIEKIIKEIGSGLNDNRDKLLTLLLDKSFTHIIIEHKDRFSRFGMNFITKLLELDGRVIEIINPPNNDKEDLMEDFVSIITSFCARLYGQRRNKRQTEKLINELNSK